MLRSVMPGGAAILSLYRSRCVLSISSIHLQPWRDPISYHRISGFALRVEPRQRFIGQTFVARSSFHSTPRNQGLPLIPLLATVLKASTSLEFARTAARIAMSLMPVILLKNHKSRRHLQHAALHGVPASEENKTMVMKKIRHRTILFHVLLFIPIIIFWATIIASLERTPLTGRWRLIILSPEEEDEIAAQLKGPGWYQAVGEIVSQDGPHQLIPVNDWRYAWVRDTLRRLESTIPILINERDMVQEWLDRGPNDIPLPPPAEHPLRPRPRASEYLRWFSEKICDRNVQPLPHAITGPPYSLLVVDKPGASNAFSYGFGPDGGGGVVVYSGFLDDILSRMPPDTSFTPSTPEKTPWWSSLLGSIFVLSPQPSRHSTPTTEQTSELAILLAHELAHLVLSHHLETLSSATVIVPGIISMAADVIRVLIFPLTMLFGPFANDAVAQMGKVGSGELIKVGDYCTTMKQEIEADVVSARLLAHAGFDARQAVKFWEDRSTTTAECSHAENIESSLSRSESLARKIMGAGHPVNEVRVDRLKSELIRWETERQAALTRLQTAPVQ